MHQLLIHQRGDHVGVAVEDIASGTQVTGVFMDDETTVEVTAGSDVPLGHKVAIEPLEAGGTVLKYGIPIGQAPDGFVLGEYVHTHNLKSARW